MGKSCKLAWDNEGSASGAVDQVVGATLALLFSVMRVLWLLPVEGHV